MSARLGSSSFLREAAFGLVVSLIAAVLSPAMAFFLTPLAVARVLITGIGFAIVLRAIVGSREKTGRIVTLALWLAAAAAAWASSIGLPAFFAIHALMTWLVRALFLRSRLLDAGLELGLTLLAASFAVFAAARTGSVFLTSWSFLLVMALGVSIPALVARWTATREASIPADDPNLGFALASKAAEEALQRIAARR